jgi:hypothetical protein
MSRHERRKAQKLSRDEIFPEGTFIGPVQTEIAGTMTRLMDHFVQKFGPNYSITFFVAEKKVPEGQNRLPRFNYASTADRATMLAIIKAWVDRHGEGLKKAEKISDEPPTPTKM